MVTNQPNALKACMRSIQRLLYADGAGRALCCLLALFVAFMLSPRCPAAATEVRLYELEIAADGNLDLASLTEAVQSIRRDQPEGPRQIVAFIHGYAAPPAAARAEYRILAGRMAGVLGAAAART